MGAENLTDINNFLVYWLQKIQLITKVLENFIEFQYQFISEEMIIVCSRMTVLLDKICQRLHRWELKI